MGEEIGGEGDGGTLALRCLLAQWLAYWAEIKCAWTVGPLALARGGWFEYLREIKGCAFAHASLGKFEGGEGTRVLGGVQVLKSKCSSTTYKGGGEGLKYLEEVKCSSWWAPRFC